MPGPRSAKRRFSSLISASSHPLRKTRLQQGEQLQLSAVFGLSKSRPFPLRGGPFPLQAIDSPYRALLMVSLSVKGLGDPFPLQGSFNGFIVGQGPGASQTRRKVHFQVLKLRFAHYTRHKKRSCSLHLTSGTVISPFLAFSSVGGVPRTPNPNTSANGS